MATEPTLTNTTYQVALDAVHALRAHRNQALHGPGDWRNPDIQLRFAAVLENTTVKVIRPGLVEAATPDTPDGAIWSYVARDALEVAAQSRAAPDGCRISQPNHHTFLLAWLT